MFQLGTETKKGECINKGKYIPSDLFGQCLFIVLKKKKIKKKQKNQKKQKKKKKFFFNDGIVLYLLSPLPYYIHYMLQ